MTAGPRKRKCAALILLLKMEANEYAHAYVQACFD